MRYFVYCRKSSEAEDRQVLSIASQEEEILRAFSSDSNLQIVDVFREAFSAKAPGREIFNSMLTRIEAGEADGIIAWHPDRLARNSMDGGRIIYLLDQCKLHDLKFSTFTFENNSQGKFMLSIIFGYSKYYVDSLSENVKRGNRAKIERGWRPNRAPIGYLNDKDTRTIIPDPERFPLVKEMFSLALTGAYTPRRICEIARTQWGLTTRKAKRRGGVPLALSSVQRMLRNPFYSGIIVWNGKQHQGAHEPVVSLNDFERLQGMLTKRPKPRPIRHKFAFTGFMRCGECGCMITAEHKVNRHGSRYCYYHCTRRKFDYRCRQPSIQASELERQLIAFLETITVPDSIHRWAITKVEQLGNDGQEAAQTHRASLEKAHANTDRALRNLTSLRVREMIDDDEFLLERKKLESDRIRCRRMLAELDNSDPAFEPFTELISFSNRAVHWFQAGDLDTKRLIFQSVCSNPRLMSKKLNIQAAKPFLHQPKSRDLSILRAVVHDVRTQYAEKDETLMGILSNIRKLNEMHSLTE